MSRPQVGIDRLPARRMSGTSEQREAMNCKSCRKRKIKCNRMRPSCEACQVFNCSCIYDAVPKKRGPKTDVLEALLKRVDGLEKRLKDEKPDSPGKKTLPEDFNEPLREQHTQSTVDVSPTNVNTIISPTGTSELSQNLPDIYIDTYFARLHGRPYYILDEAATRQRILLNQLPSYLLYAIYAVTARYATGINGYNAAVRASQEYSARARMEMDIDEPSIENLQTLLLLAQANFQGGKGKKTYMLLSNAISMVFALGLHRELPMHLKIAAAEREGRRRLFWACYLLDRFTASGSKRPSIISDESIFLRLPSWQLHPGSTSIEGEFFPNGTSHQYIAGPGKQAQGGMSTLIDIVRILGTTNRYLAAGGVKGDSHFPWHALSNLSKIRQELDIWAAGTQDTFSSLESIFGQPDSATLVLAKLIYHLIHCLIYRPFLPVDLAELSGTGQHQSWQIEATNFCFLHANAIMDLMEIGKASGISEWPAFVGYCICTAGTIHVHGAHYRGNQGDVFSASTDYLSREMSQLSELRLVWAGVQHQRDTLQTVYGCHSELVKSLASNPIRFSSVFHLEDFFDRYPGQFVDGSHVTFAPIAIEPVHEPIASYGKDRSNSYLNQQNTGYSAFAQHSMPLGQPHQLPQTSLQPAAHTPVQNIGSQQHDHVQATPQQAQPLAPPAYPPENKLKRRTTSSKMSPPLTTPSATGEPSTSASNVSPSNPQQQQQSLVPVTPALEQATIDSQRPSGFTPMPFSPNFNLNALPTDISFQDPNFHFDPMFSIPTPYDQGATPGGASAAGSAHTDPDKDPFLTLLEQLAENEHSRGGPSELDYFLGQT